MTGNVTFNNAIKIQGKGYDGSTYEIMRMGGDYTNKVVLCIGDGLFSAKKGRTNVGGGEAVRLCLPNETVDFMPMSNSTTEWCFKAGHNNTVHLGNSSYKWKTVYAMNATIQTSDVREKENILPIGTVMTETCGEDSHPVNVHESLFDSLKPVQYNFINDPSRICYGLIAQDVAASMEELGIGENDLDLVHHDYDTNEETGEVKDTYGLSYANLIPLLIHEVQKLKSRVDELECQLKDK